MPLDKRSGKVCQHGNHENTKGRKLETVFLISSLRVFVIIFAAPVQQVRLRRGRGGGIRPTLAPRRLRSIGGSSFPRRRPCYGCGRRNTRRPRYKTRRY